MEERATDSDQSREVQTLLSELRSTVEQQMKRGSRPLLVRILTTPVALGGRVSIEPRGLEQFINIELSGQSNSTGARLSLVVFATRRTVPRALRHAG